jgi:hypothetical protein
MKKPALISVVLFVASVISDFQSADGKPKFLGNILDTSQIDEKFATYWNQVTAENGDKRSQLAGSWIGRSSMPSIGSHSVTTSHLRNTISFGEKTSQSG